MESQVDLKMSFPSSVDVGEVRIWIRRTGIDVGGPKLEAGKLD
jgi:hypothetical protein